MHTRRKNTFLATAIYTRIAMRTTKEVLTSHLQLRKEGNIAEDLKRNYHDEVVLLSVHGIHNGHEGVKKCAEILHNEVPDPSFEFKNLQISGEIAFLEWSAYSKNLGLKITDGADSYVIRNGHIVAQTIHYLIKPKD